MLEDLKEITEVILLGILMVAIIAVVLVGIVLPFVQFEKTADLTIEGDVIAVIQSSLLWEHTTIHMKTYAEETITITVEGYHELQVDSVYRICVSGSFWRFYRTLEEITLIG